MITSGGRKSETTMEDKSMVIVCGYPELYDTTYFYKNRNKKDLAWKKVSEEVGQSSKLLKTLFTQFEIYIYIYSIYSAQRK